MLNLASQATLATSSCGHMTRLMVAVNDDLIFEWAEHGPGGTVVRLDGRTVRVLELVRLADDAGPIGLGLTVTPA